MWGRPAKAGSPGRFSLPAWGAPAPNAFIQRTPDPLTGRRLAGYRGAHMALPGPLPIVIDGLCQQCGTVVPYSAHHELLDCVRCLHQRLIDLEHKYAALARIWAYEIARDAG